MKRRTLLFISTSVIFLLISCNKENITEPENPENLFSNIDTTLNIDTIQEGNITLFKIDKYNTLVVKIPYISSYLFLERPEKSLEEIANDSGYSVVVNSSYFDFEYDDPVTYSGRRYRPAGFLKINNIIYENIKDDRQLSSLFAYNSKKNIVHYFSINELDKTNSYDLVVQTGPQIIRSNEIDTISIKTSINGELGWQRTVFASVNDNEFYIIVNLALTNVNLIELGKMLKSTGIFKKELNIINFDGGFSTSIYIKNHPEFSYNPGYKMPLLICVK